MATKLAEAEATKLVVQDNPLGRRAVFAGEAEIPAIPAERVSEVASGLGVAVPLYRRNLAADFQAGTLRRGARLSFQARLTLKVWDDRQAALRLYLRRSVAGAKASARAEAGKRLLRRRLCVLAWRSRAGTFGPGRERVSGTDLSRVRLGSVLAVEVVVTKQGWPYLLRATVEWGGTLGHATPPEGNDPLPVEEAGPPGMHAPTRGDGEQKETNWSPPLPESPSEEVAPDEEGVAQSDAGEEGEGKASGKEARQALPTGFFLPDGTPVREGDVLLAGEERIGPVEWCAGEGRFFAGERSLRDWLQEEDGEAAATQNASCEPTEKVHA